MLALLYVERGADFLPISNFTDELFLEVTHTVDRIRESTVPYLRLIRPCYFNFE